MKTVSSREFNNDVAGAKRAATKEPVFITDRGEASFVLLSVDRYRQLTKSGQSALSALRERAASMDGLDLGFDWEPPQLMREAVRPAEFGD